MFDIEGFHVRQAGPDAPGRTAVVLLHGSGGSEISLLGLGRRAAPGRTLLAVRGPVRWDGGFAFFRRNPDRTLDHADLEARCAAFCAFLEALADRGWRRPVLLGFSNGAIMAAAAVLRAPRLTAGAVLLRPLAPSPGPFPPLDGYPVLIVGGTQDTRRDPADAPYLAGLFRAAGARVTAHILPVGHAPDERDVEVAGAWLTPMR